MAPKFTSTKLNRCRTPDIVKFDEWEGFGALEVDELDTLEEEELEYTMPEDELVGWKVEVVVGNAA